MTKKTATPAEIARQIAAVSKTIEALEIEAEGLALSVVSGDTDAVKRMLAIRSEIDRANADQIMLERAVAGAIAFAEETAKREAAATKAAALVLGRKQAARIVKIADRLDVIAAEFTALAGELTQLEFATGSSVRAAGFPDQARTYRRGVALIAANNVAGWNAPINRPRPPVGPLVRSGWAILLEDEANV
jgi:hypothetical protein